MKKQLLFLTMISFLCVTSIPAQPVEEWVARYNGPTNGNDLPGAIVLDSAGNIYVTGRSSYPGAMYDIVTIKYASNGDSLWSAHYSGSTNQDDGAVDIYVDDSSYVYVTGYCDTGISGGDWITIKYNPNGTEAWNRVYPDGIGAAIVLDGEGNVIVTGSSGNPSDITTIKYSPDGDSLWVKFYNGPLNGYDYGEDLTVDENNNIYVTGDVAANPGSFVYADYATIKYNPDGEVLWAASYDPFGLWADTPIEILLDSSGDVYVFGSSSSTEMNADFALVKYDPSKGAQIWDARYDATGSTDLASGMALDPSGNIIVTGGSMISGVPGHYNYVTIKYNSSGNQNWIAQYDGPANKWDLPYGGVALDSEGNSFVGGRSQGLGDDYDFATVAYDSGGTQLWVMRYDGPANGDDYGDGGVVVDNNGNVYITGTSKGIGTYADYTTIKYGYLVDVDDEVSNIPTGFALEQNYPNPFNPSTSIQYAISSRQFVTLRIYDVLGNEIVTLVNEEKPAGNYEVEFGTDQNNNLSSGVYFYQLEAGLYMKTKKMILLR